MKQEQLIYELLNDCLPINIERKDVMGLAKKIILTLFNDDMKYKPLDHEIFIEKEINFQREININIGRRYEGKTIRIYIKDISK